jgi:hypothetical protein
MSGAWLSGHLARPSKIAAGHKYNKSEATRLLTPNWYETKSRWPWTLLSFTRACHALPFYVLWAGHPLNGLTAVSGVDRSQGGRPAAVLYPLGHSTPYAYDQNYHVLKCFHSEVKREMSMETYIGVRRGVSEGVKDGHKPLTLWVGHSWNSHKTVSGVARSQGVEG